MSTLIPIYRSVEELLHLVWSPDRLKEVLP